MKRQIKSKTINMHPIEFNSKILLKVENDISSKAKKIFSTASKKTLDSGNSILQVIDNSIYKISPDGKKTKIKDIEKSIKIDTKNYTYKIK